MMGRVFNIQRFSIHDGPGIRTTVFLKGCPLRCLWCHNPESIAREREIAFFPTKCIGCRRCFAACPSGALTLVPVGGAVPGEEGSGVGGQESGEEEGARGDGNDECRMTNDEPKPKQEEHKGGSAPPNEAPTRPSSFGIDSPSVIRHSSFPSSSPSRGDEARPPSPGMERHYQKTLCRLCGQCVEACFAEALVMEGRDVTAEEVVAEVLKDKPFYDNSGGGATVSGGEPLLQADFAAEILARCHASGVHACLDTSAHAPWEAFEKALPHTDLVLLDLKLMDGERHRQATGVGNERILANARRLAATGIPIVVRIPIIPGYTDDEANLSAIADFLPELPSLDYVELLPYHRFAEAKYHRLGRRYELEGTGPPTQERLDGLAELFARRGFRVKAGQTTRR